MGNSTLDVVFHDFYEIGGSSTFSSGVRIVFQVFFGLGVTLLSPPEWMFSFTSSMRLGVTSGMEVLFFALYGHMVTILSIPVWKLCLLCLLWNQV